MSNMAAPAGERKFTGWHMLAIMICFFGTIITVNLIMAYNASKTWTGLVVKNSYVASQHFNDVTAEKRAQRALGWQAQVGFQREVFAVTLKDASGDALNQAIVTVKLGRPAYEAEDRTVTLTANGNGSYGAQTSLKSGIWQADLTVTGSKGEIWTRSHRFVVEE